MLTKEHVQCMPGSFIDPKFRAIIQPPYEIGHPWQSQLESLMRSSFKTKGAALKRLNAEIRAVRLAAARSKGTHSVEQWQALKQEFDFHCVRCGCLPESLSKDHIIPIYQGGSDSLDNLQPLCIHCNLSKGRESTNWVEIRRQEKLG